MVRSDLRSFQESQFQLQHTGFSPSPSACPAVGLRYADNWHLVKSDFGCKNQRVVTANRAGAARASRTPRHGQREPDDVDGAAARVLTGTRVVSRIL